MLLLVISISHKTTTLSSLTRGLIREEGERGSGFFFRVNTLLPVPKILGEFMSKTLILS